MQTTARLAAFALGLVAVGGTAAALGGATGATPPFQSCLSADASGTGGSMAMNSAGGAPSMAAMVAGADGSRTKLRGLTLDPDQQTLDARAATTWRFRIADCEGNAVRRFERDQTKLLHLIVVRSDLTGYQHLHPTLAADGTFAVDMRPRRPGRYRAIADFTTGGRRYVLGTTLTVPGTAPSTPLPAPLTQASVDGYDVTLSRPATLAAGHEATLTFRITRRGAAVRELQPYLGAFGHLVALHAPGLEYSHVHPAARNLAAGTLTFDAELPKAGAYRLFVQFRTSGRVHTAAFTLHASPAAHSDAQEQS